jgi:hypothetical protein
MLQGGLGLIDKVLGGEVARHEAHRFNPITISLDSYN